MPRYLIELEYDGRNFNGTQAQANGRTLQRVLEAAVAELNGAPTAIRLSSRLDAEVSAARLPFDCLLERTWHPAVLCLALAARLPKDVGVLRAAAVADDFNAQHDALEKTYSYALQRRPSRPALDQRAWWVRQIDQPEILHQLAPLIIGERDLSGFACLRHDGTDADDPRRTIHAADWNIIPDAGGNGERLAFRVRGAGFLYKQIRGLVGAMIYVAQGRKTADDFRSTIAAGRAAERIGNIAPGHGLLLDHVAYATAPAWIEPLPEVVNAALNARAKPAD